MEVVVGIDPQPNNISYCATAIDQRATLPVVWVMVCLKQRSAFNTAQEWQRYIIDQVHGIFKDLQNNRQIKIKCVCIEQQKGRVNSIIEQTLFCISLGYNFNTIIVHPRKWKSFHNFQKGTNYNHKQQAEDKVKQILVEYCTCNHIKTPTGRLHDLCDAFLISKSAVNWLE